MVNFFTISIYLFVCALHVRCRHRRLLGLLYWQQLHRLQVQPEHLRLPRQVLCEGGHHRGGANAAAAAAVAGGGEKVGGGDRILKKIQKFKVI